MSVLIERGMGESQQNTKSIMYPLFQRGAKTKPPSSKYTPTESEKSTDNPARPKKKLPRSPSKRSKLPEKAGSLSLEGQTNPAVNVSNLQNPAELLEVDPNDRRRKRRKTASLDGEVPSAEAEASNDQPAEYKSNRGNRNDLLQPKPVDLKSERCKNGPRGVFPVEPASEILYTDQDTPPPESARINSKKGHQKSDLWNTGTNPNQAQDHPKKFLRLNPKTGTIGSPPARTVPLLASLAGAKTTKSSKTMIITVPYGQGERLRSFTGEQINRILFTQPKIPKPKEAAPATSDSQTSSVSNSAKPIHPLFLGKSGAKAPSPRKSASTETTDLTESKDSATQPRARSFSRENTTLAKKPAVSFSGLGSSTRTVKFPGAVEPAWPWRGMTHVRGLDGNMHIPDTKSTCIPLITSLKKSKYQAVSISSAEDIIEILASQLSIKSVINSIREIRPDDYPTTPQCLRIPTRCYKSGIAIQRRIRKEVKACLVAPKVVESSGEDAVQVNGRAHAHIHCALTKVYGNIATSMSAFDKGQCETQAWAQKYSPKCAADVLQSGTEALILKNWLQALTVQCVEAGSGGDGRAATKIDAPGKRKRKTKRLDNFVITTDEEDNEMDEITDPEEASGGSQSQLKRTVVKAKDAAALLSKGAKVSNAVVISGPHGCGKTAAIYAVAKELGFEVFEINPSSRRSGKDILEKVGDMTQNHQVQRTAAIPRLDKADEDSAQIGDTLADELQMGRQGTMNSFFKPSTIEKPKLKPKARNSTDATPGTAKEKSTSNLRVPTPDASKHSSFSRTPAKKQKQSLVLIEEADVLYKEDAQFWTTIISLIATSKRPILMTCTDEAILPMGTLDLYAIIRMVSPPIDLAVDYMLLVAASEGHIIKRAAVSTLYEGRNYDLRASLMELNFWCQFTIGDVKGGLEWYYPRWPAGNDVDEHGNTIRVTSEGTYEPGMGWLSQDFLESHLHYLDIEEETLHEACDGWNFDLGNWWESIGLEAWADKIQDLSSSKRDTRAALSMYAEFADSMSVADLCSGGTFAPVNRISLDVSSPALSAKARDDYTLAYELKETPPLVDYNTSSKDISLYMKSRARKILHVDQHVRHQFEVPPELDRPCEADILRLICDQVASPNQSLTRYDFSRAFDPISAQEKYVESTTLDASNFDRTMTLIVEDLAPYVRSIVAYDAQLQVDRLKLSNLLSEGGRRGKRMRTTRAAISALEGGARGSIRRDRYFAAALNFAFVLKTGMPEWTQAMLAETIPLEVEAESRRSSRSSTEEESKVDNERDELI
ncbi:hypothetical protein QTJ16_000199 [Diplocarpon rosae]|uniref:AAA+ ATPase domain-containing protein n=1 Tax=Diplocarpon rosae TaxID=946125 RepID=A0AAD9T6B5_9HELO|nr:hypothetical protein QTJ16_000199 [Diplocarpon rosae]